MKNKYSGIGCSFDEPGCFNPEEFDFDHNDYVAITFICLVMQKQEKGELTICSEFLLWIIFDLLTKDNND